MWYANYFACVIPLSRLKAYYCTFLPFVLRIYFDHNIIPEFTFICPMWYIFRIKLLHKSDPIKWVPLFAHWVSYALSHHAILCGKDWFELVGKEERISTFFRYFWKSTRLNNNLGGMAFSLNATTKCTHLSMTRWTCSPDILTTDPFWPLVPVRPMN